MIPRINFPKLEREYIKRARYYENSNWQVDTFEGTPWRLVFSGDDGGRSGRRANGQCDLFWQRESSVGFSSVAHTHKGKRWVCARLIFTSILPPRLWASSSGATTSFLRGGRNLWLEDFNLSLGWRIYNFEGSFYGVCTNSGWEWDFRKEEFFPFEIICEKKMYN